jgi:hypothetical protein
MFQYEVLISTKQRKNYRKSDGLMSAWGWAVDNFGQPGMIQLSTPPRWNFDSNLTFYFRDEADAVLFTLAWT